MDYKEIAFYLSLLFIVGSLAEIYSRKKEYAELQKANRGKKFVAPFRGILFPMLLLFCTIITAVAIRVVD